jgi:hypothetical protein
VIRNRGFVKKYIPGEVEDPKKRPKKQFKKFGKSLIFFFTDAARELRKEEKVCTGLVHE